MLKRLNAALSVAKGKLNVGITCKHPAPASVPSTRRRPRRGRFCSCLARASGEARPALPAVVGRTTHARPLSLRGGTSRSVLPAKDRGAHQGAGSPPRQALPMRCVCSGPTRSVCRVRGVLPRGGGGYWAKPGEASVLLGEAPNLSSKPPGGLLMVYSFCGDSRALGDRPRAAPTSVRRLRFARSV